MKDRWAHHGLVFTAILAAWLPSLAMAALTCPPSRAQVVIDVTLPKPVIDNTLPQPALQDLAGAAHHGGRALGLYRAKFQAESSITLGNYTLGEETCRWIQKVKIEITMPERTIFITRERRPGTCPYNAVLRHERKHQAADEVVLHDHLSRLRRRVERAVAALPPARPMPLPDANAAEERLVKAVGTAIDAAMGELGAARKARQAKIDVPSEYRRVGAACG